MAEMELPADPATPPPTKPRRTLRWLIAIATAVCVLLMLVILAAPTLISSGPVVAIALASVNKSLNGEVKIDSLSLGWFTGARVKGLKVRDQQGNQIASVDQMTIAFPLWKAITGKFNLGLVTVDGINFDAKYDSQGRLNFTELQKPSPVQPVSRQTTSTPKSSSSPAKLPEISAHLKLTNVHGTVSHPQKPTIYLTRMTGDVNIPDINGPITNQLELALKTTDRETVFTTSGVASIISDRQLNLTGKATAHQTVELRDLDPGLATPFLSDAIGLQTLQGLLGVNLTVDLQEGGNLVVDGGVKSQAPLAVGGSKLNGDVFRSNVLDVQVPHLSVDLSRGLDQWKLARIRTGASPSSSPISVKLDQGEITASADVVPQALLNFLIGQAPGSSGQIAINSNFDLGKIIPQLKNTLPAPAGVTIDGGGFSQTVNVVISNEKLDFSEKTQTTQITGTQTGAGATPSPITVDPIHIALAAGGQSLLNPQNINLEIQSKFANGKFHGNSISDLNGQLTADLKVLRNQIGQFIDLKKQSFNGTVVVNLADTGQLLKTPYQGGINLDVTAKNLEYANGDEHFSQPEVQLILNADLQGTAQNTVDQIKKLTTTLKTGDAEPLVTDLTAELTGVQLTPAATSALNIVRTAHLQISIPDIKPVMDLANAFTTATQANNTAVASGKAVTPLNFSSGTLLVTGDLSHEGSTAKLSNVQINADKLATKRGEVAYTFKPVRFSLSALADLPDAGAIQKIQVSTLTGDLGLATLSMPTPVTVSMGANPEATGAIKLVGNLTDLTQMLAAIQGEKPSAYPYRGDYTLTENVGTQQHTISLKGGLQIAKLQSYNGDAITFSEDLLSVANDVAISFESDDQSLAINSISAAMQSSGALKLTLNSGSIGHLNHAREINLHPAIDYDLARLWPVIQPMMGDKYKTLKIAGHYQKQFNVSGSYPAEEPFTTAVKQLHADGDLAVESFDYNGLTLQNFVVPFDLDNGQLVTLYANKSPAPAASANGGTLDLNNFTIDLTQSPPRLSAPQNKAVVNNLTINPLFSDSYLAKVINNPLFAGTRDASGLFGLTITDCSQLPMGELVTLPTPENTGKIDLNFSITKLHIGLATDALQSILKQNTFDANVNNGTVALARGVCTEHVKFVTGDYTLGFDGSVRLKDQALIPLTLSFPLAAIASKTHMVKDANVLAVLPDSLAIPVEGTVSAPKYRFEKILPKAIADATAKGIAKGLLGGNKNGGDNDTLGGLLNKLEKKKKN